jgi:hypothetical protein
MKRAVGILICIAIFVAAGLPAIAQDQSRRALAEQLMNVVHVKENTQKTFALFKNMINAQIQKMKAAAGTGAKASEASKRTDKIMDLLEQEFQWDKVKDEYITLYAKTFSAEELKSIIAFYKTPAGQAFVKKQPELMKRSMELTEKRIKDVLPKIQAMAKEAAKSVRPSGPAKPSTK